MSEMKWEVLYDAAVAGGSDEIVKILLENRGLKTKKQQKEFLDPAHPNDIELKDVGLKRAPITKSIKRIKKAIKDKEKVVVYGDYDADGVTATAILWECLYEQGVDVKPFIPNRFREGYGLNEKGIETVLNENPDSRLIITVDNGIVANKAVDLAKENGIDVIVSDHHQKGDTLPKAHAVIHSTDIGGAGVAWFFAREIRKEFDDELSDVGLDLACIGTISDQIPLTGANRSIVKFGLKLLGNTLRPGMNSLYKESGIHDGKGVLKINTYDVGFVIAPRINAVGRLESGIDALRLLCTKNPSRAKELASYLGKTNKSRQNVVAEVVEHSKTQAESGDWKGAIMVAHSDYHEGVIGLAASKLVELYYRPAIVFSVKDGIAKASARSIKGFNMIENIRKLDDLLSAGGGHPMAAGFSLPEELLEEFIKRFTEISAKELTDDVLTKSLRVDMEIDFRDLNWELLDDIAKLAPFGLGNPTPTFSTRGVKVLDAKAVGSDAKHLKLKVEKDGVFDAIAFGFGDYYKDLLASGLVDIAYNFEVNEFRGTKSMQLKIKDIKIL